MAAQAGDLSIKIRITADGSQAIVNLRRTEDATRSLGNTSRQAAGGLDSVAKSLAGVAAGYLSLQGLERLVSSLVTITDEAARLDAAYNMIFGSAGAAADALSRVTEMANRAGINSREAAKAFQSLAAAAQGTALESQAFDIFESVAIAMAKLGKNSFDTAGALKALEQMISKGNVQAEELRGQLGDRLPGAFKLTANAMGVTTAELNKMLVLGQVTAEEMLPKLTDELNRVYGNSAFAETVAADWERLGNVISGPGGLAETVNKAIGLNEFLMDVLKDVTSAATAMNTALNNGQVASALAGWSEAFSDAATYAGQMAVGIYALADEWYRFVQALAGADADQIRTLWEDLTLLAGGFADAMLKLPDNVAGVTYIIAAELDILSEKFSAHWDMIAASSDLLWDSLKLAVPETFAAIQKVVGEAVLWIGKKLQDLTTDMAEFARLAAELPGVGDFAAGIADQLDDLGTRLRDSTLAFMWDQYASANSLTEQLREEVQASSEAVDAAGERVKGLEEYARQARETAVDLINLNEAERERARFMREWDAEAERIFAEMDAFNASATGNVASSPASTWLDEHAEALQSLIDQYVPGAKDARTFAEAQSLLQKAVAEGKITQEQASQILDAMRQKMAGAVSGTKDLIKAQQDLAQSMADVFSQMRERMGGDALDAMRTSAAQLAGQLTEVQTAAANVGGAVASAGQTVVDLVKQFEGLKLDAYLDQAGVPTIGYGHTGPEVKIGMRIDMAEAERLFAQDLSKFEDVVRDTVKVSLTENQAAALTSLAYNIGEGAFKGSTLVKLLNLGDYEAAANEFDKWTKVTVDGLKQTSQGLVNRRNLEEAVFRGSSESLQQVTADTRAASDATITLGQSVGTTADQVAAFVARISGGSNPIAQLTTDIQSYQQATVNQIPLMSEVLYWQDKIRSGVQLNAAQLAAAEKATDRLSSAESALSTERERLVDLDTKLVASGQQRNRQIELSEKTLESIADQYGSTYVAQRKYRVELDNIEQAYRSGWLNAEEYADALKDIRLEYQSSQGPMAEYLAELERGIGGMEAFGVEIMDSLVSNIADGLADGKLQFRDFVDDIKSYLAEIAAKKIVLTFAASLGLTGTTAAVASGATGAASAVGSAGSTVSGLSGLGTLGNLGSMLTSNSLGSTLGLTMAQSSLTSWVPTSGITNLMGVSNWMLGGSTIAGSLLGSALFDGGYSDVGSSIGSAAGSVIGTMILPGIGTVLGSLLGGTGGGFLGSLFGSDTPEFGGYQMSFSGLGFEDDVKARGGFGLSFGATGTGTTNMDMTEYQDAFDGLAAVSQTLADFYGDELEQMVQASLQAQLGDYQKFSRDLDTAFEQIFSRIIDTAANVDTEIGGMGRLLDVVIDASGGLQALGSSAEQMAKVIQGGIEIATYTTKLFNTEVGKLLGMGVGEEFDTMAESAAALTWYVQAFWKDGETSASMIERFVTNLQALDAAVQLTGGELDSLGFSSMELMIIAEDLRASIEDLGLSMSDFATLQSAYYEAAYGEAERAAHQAESAREAIAAWNAEMGRSGDATIDTLAELRAYIESLYEYSTDYNDLYTSAIAASGAFIQLDEALKTLGGTASETTDTLVADFIASITPVSVQQSAALAEMTDLFAKWGMQIPATSEALYALIQAGWVSDENLLRILAENTDKLELAWDAISATMTTGAEDFIASITPVPIKQNAALTEMTALFAQWGMQVPVTSEALYALVQAGAFTNAQLEALATNADQLGLAWTAIAAAQEAAIAELTTAYDEAVANAKTSISDRIDAITTASDERIATLREASDAALTTLRERYETLAGTLNTELDATQDALQSFSDVVDATSDALRSLTEQTDGIDETRQRALAEARSAIEQYATTGTLPDDITDTIGRLDTVDPNDFATRSEWLAAIAENAAVLSALEGIGAERVSEAERQIQLLEAQIEQAAAQYEASVDAENARLERLIAAEEAHRDALIAAVNQVQTDLLARLQAEYDTQVEAIRSGDEATVATIRQTNALLENLLASVDALDLKIVNVNTAAMRSVPGFASGGAHAGGLRIVGELGPEIEYTGPSHVAPNSDLGGLFREGNSDVAEAVQALRDELRDLRALQSSQSNLIQALLKIHKRWDGEGLPPDRADYLRTLAEATETTP